MKNYIKFTLDLIMGIVFALLFNKNVLGGMNFHEIAGLAIGFAVIIHILLNWKWVKNVSLAIFNKKIALKTRIGYILNILLFLDMAVIIISGILISKVVFPTLRMQSSFFNRGTHVAASYIALAIIGIHLGLHWNWVMNMFKKFIKIKAENKIIGYISKAAAVLVLVFGIYSMISVNYISNTMQIFTSGNQASFEQRGDGRQGFQFQQPSQNNNGIVDSQQQNGNNGIPQNFQDGRTGRPDFPGGGKGMMEGKGRGSVSISGLLANNLSIMGVFAVFTCYLEKLLIRKKQYNS